jgi:hypothetical protein
MDGRGATTESSLSDGASLLSISAAIKQHHLHESISHLLIEILKFVIIKISIRMAFSGEALFLSPRYWRTFSLCNCLGHRRWSLRYIGSQLRELPLADD